MRAVYSTMDTCSDTLSALQTEGLMTGFYEMLLCMFRAPTHPRTQSPKTSKTLVESCKPRIEGKVKVEMENARRVYLILAQHSINPNLCIQTWCPHMGVSENRGYLILGSLQYASYYLRCYIGVPYFRKLPYKPQTSILPREPNSP